MFSNYRKCPSHAQLVKIHRNPGASSIYSRHSGTHTAAGVPGTVDPQDQEAGRRTAAEKNPVERPRPSDISVLGCHIAKRYPAADIEKTFFVQGLASEFRLVAHDNLPGAQLQTSCSYSSSDLGDDE